MLQKTIAQFIPIILIFVTITSFRKLLSFSNTTLGKLLAVIVIIFYTTIDKILGVFVCALVIFYYQTAVVENMLNMDVDNNYTTEFVGEENTELLDDYVFLSKEEKNRKHRENLVNYTELDDKKDILIGNEKLQDEFRKNSCVNNELTNKGVDVKYEMAEHVFPEIKFRRGACNPCLKTCEFSIIEKKINTEIALQPLTK
jgi:hypothetical protein